MNASAKPATNSPATCPACGLLCDDITPSNNNCAKSIAFFGQGLGNINPKIKGKKVSLQEAIKTAKQILKNSQNPLFSGLSTDVDGFRALYSLAEKTNATLSHMNSASMQRNMRVLQSSGWQTTTLTEVKNRADLIVCIGSDIVAHNPRFFERFVNTEGMFADGKVSKREVIFLGAQSHKSNALEAASRLPCKPSQLPEVLAVLHALVLGKRLKVKQVAEIEVADLQALADKLRSAKYAVMTWVAKDFDSPYAELIIEQVTQTVAALNQTTRAAGLPLGGSDGDSSANNANTWLSGLTLSNEETVQHDAMLWVNSFSPEKHPIKSELPLIVLGNANLQFEHEPDVFIPIATPGLDCSGMLFRVDSSIILPLKKVRESNLPTLSEILRQIEVELT